MQKRTRYIVYVDKDIMDKHAPLFDVVFAHLVSKGVDMAVRRQFVSQYMLATRAGNPLDVIQAWVQVRDVESFPFRREEEKLAKTAEELGMTVEEVVEAGKAIGVAPLEAITPEEDEVEDE